MLSVTYFYRQPRKTGLSIEGIFQLIKIRLQQKVVITEFYCDERFSRIQNIRHARKAAGYINHITGDVNYLAIGFAGKKNVLTIHDFGHFENLKKRGFLQSFIYELFWYRLPLINIDIVTVVSEYTKGKLIEYLNFPENKIRVIPNPVKPVFKFSEKKELNAIPRILQIGSGPHKNLRNLILAAIGTNFHLDIIAYVNEEDQTLLDKNKISYTIYQGLTDDEIYDRYVKCDVLFFASFHEGFGMPIIEAQAVGRPVITSNYGAMKEVAKESAFLVDPNNPIQIKETIDQLLNNKITYDKYVRLGSNNIVPYNEDKIATQYQEVYKYLSAKK